MCQYLKLHCVQMYSGMKEANSRSVVKPHATRGERFAMPYVRRPCHFMSDVKYSHAVNDLARRMLDALSAELPWVKAVLPKGVYSVCDRALVTLNFAFALHRDSRDKVSTTVFVFCLSVFESALHCR